MTNTGGKEGQKEKRKPRKNRRRAADNERNGEWGRSKDVFVKAASKVVYYAE
jgi:hypothetical protein